MLFDPQVLMEAPVKVLAVVAIILIGKSAAAAGLVLLLRYPLNTALTVSAALAQIGEFSFILVALGLSLGVFPEEGQSLIVAGALISIAVNPFVFAAIEPGLRWIRSRSELARSLDSRDDPLAQLPMSTDTRYLSDQVVIVGYGRVGGAVALALRERHIPFIVVEENRELVERMRAEGQATVFGNATEPETLVQAHIATARMLVIATPETIEVRRMIETGRTLNPKLDIVIRSHNPEEARLLERESAGKVFVGEQELAKAMTSYVVETIARGEPAPLASGEDRRSN